MEKPEINLEKIHLLIDKLKTQVSDSSGSEHLLSTAQMLVAELQTLQRTEKPRPSVSVVMPTGSGIQRTVNQPVSNNTNLQTSQNRQSDLLPPVTVTEQSPEEMMDRHAFDNLPNKTAASVAPATPDIHQHEPEKTNETLSAAHEVDTHDIAEIDREVVSNVSDAENGLDQAPDTNITPEFPTSIPSDKPEIQDAEGPVPARVNENSAAQESASHPAPYRAPAPPSHQPVPAAHLADNSESSAEVERAVAASAPPVEPAPETTERRENDVVSDQSSEISYGNASTEDKKRQLDFIHENFSAWSDYGIVNEAPTLIQNKIQPASDTQMDLNDQLKEDREEWGHTLQSTPIDNLAAAIGINDRYLFISELFRGDESMYERSILTLNKFQNFDQAHAWSERELRLKLGWDMENSITRQFEQLVKRRFMKRS